MDDADLILLRDLLRDQRLLALAVVVGGEPVAGLVPFLGAPDLAALVVHVSALAPHSAGLGNGAPWSGVVHVPDAREVDPLRVPRVVVHGHARRIQDARVLDAIGQAWVERFPSAAQTVGLGDFAFVSLDIEGGRLIGGFATARNLSPSHFKKAAAPA
jgi:heme iron utilization protein